jgi:hypothetical protein
LIVPRPLGLADEYMAVATDLGIRSLDDSQDSRLNSADGYSSPRLPHTPDAALEMTIVMSTMKTLSEKVNLMSAYSNSVVAIRKE